MKSFLARNWPFIVIPIVIVLIFVAVILFMEDGDPEAGFSYPL
ncbi:MAG: hypothetical protein AAGA20_16310 [Planctomycetota bacterium]